MIRHGVWAPADTPIGTVERLAGDMTSAISYPAVHDWLVTEDPSLTAHGCQQRLVLCGDA
jgi:hypothetical protein